MTKIKQQQYQELLSKDQLNMERNDGKVFLHFGEPWAHGEFWSIQTYSEECVTYCNLADAVCDFLYQLCSVHHLIV